MKATHIYAEKFDTNRKLANRVLKALNDITELNNGTIRNPFELASVILSDSRTLIETLYEDGEINYSDGFYVVDVDYFKIYVDVVGKFAEECGEYEYITDEGISSAEDEE